MNIPANKNFLEKNNNNFNLIRLIAAILVIYSHSYALVKTQSSGDVISRITGVTHAGELSVAVFFFISGMFVAKSLFDSSNVSEYFIKRIFRIYPALIVCCFLSAYIFLPSFGGLSLSDVLVSPDAWDYFWKNASATWNVYFIPGAYKGHNNSGLNGSLWSINLEVRLYLVLGIYALFGLTKSSLLRVIALISSLIILGVNSKYIPLIGSNDPPFGADVYPTFSSIFLLGSLYVALKLPIRVNLLTIFSSCILMFLAKGTILFLFSIFLFTIMLSIWVATNGFFIKNFRIKNDYSYGIYLYGWPAQQIIVSLNGADNPINPNTITAFAVPLAFLFAYLSWHLLEKKFIKFSHLISLRISRG